MSVPPERRYSEEEAGAILRRATELSAGPGPADGMTLAELERLAAEFGIDARHVRTAAASLSQVDAPTRAIVEVERLAAARLTDEAWDAAVAELRRTYGAPGDCTQVGGTREWACREDTASIHAAFAERDGRVRVRLLRSLEGAVGVTWAMFGIFAGLAVLLSTIAGFRMGPMVGLWNLLLATAISGMIGFGLRGLMQSWFARTRRNVDALADRLVGLLEAEAPVEAVEAAAAPPVRTARDEEPAEVRVGVGGDPGAG